VRGARELAFFPGAAVGSVVPGFDYASEAGAAAVHVRFAAAGAAAAHAAAAPQPALDDECMAYANGAPAFVLPPDGGALTAGVAVLARYAVGARGGGAPAAVRCAVGAGCAVLCGPHPEMAPHWLAPPVDACDAARACAASAVRATVLHASLAAADAGRARFWRALLSAAGVPLRSRPGSALGVALGGGALDEASLEAPPSPLRSIRLGPTAPAADVAARSSLPPQPAPPPQQAQQARRVSVSAGLGPLRAMSHADLMALPAVPPLHTLLPAEEAAAAEGGGGGGGGGGRVVYAPLPRLAGWLGVTAALVGASRALSSARAPRLARLAASSAGAAALAAGASIRFGGPRGGVPITAQTLSACLCGLALGARGGVHASALYAAAAAAGLPVLTPHAGRPTTRGSHTASSGYVAGFALCAWAVGRTAQAAADARASRAAFGTAVALAAAAAQLATAALGGAWAACLLMSEGAAPDAAATGGKPRPWLLELALASAHSVPPFLPGLLLKALAAGAAAAVAAPALQAPPPPPRPALRQLLDG
jgi:biotin transporter BioY